MSIIEVLGVATLFYLVFKLLNFIANTFLLPSTNWSKYGTKSNSWAVVTGSTDGIGKEFALQLATKGLNIILVARDAEKLKATKQEIEKNSKVSIVTFVMDFAQPAKDTIEKFVHDLKDKKVTVLVNNVGVSHAHPEYFIETAPEAIEAIIKINVLNTLLFTRALLPGMVERKNGLILNLGSFSGETPIPLLQTYSASKSFLKAWSMALSAEVEHQGVQVQLLNTYFVVSKLSRRKRATMFIPSPEDYVKAALRNAGQTAFATPYPMHALLGLLMDCLPTMALTKFNLATMRATRQVALQKAKRSD